ncbi:hypothetical protein [Aureivirga sp. CE67]|uniref:hypothetical protein n=1 Tax=Aureivirga sp. CE67 TaxID=1788983 RepID=UPI0018CAE8EA|nr:hypothetical protein [Aureivirga sp. CE67]
MNFIDFIIGVLLMNSMPHLIFGLTKSHFLGLFGYSSKGNISYAILQFIICIVLLFINYDLNEILKNYFLLGSFTVLILYFILGKFMVKFYKKQKPENK